MLHQPALPGILDLPVGDGEIAEANRLVALEIVAQRPLDAAIEAMAEAARSNDAVGVAKADIAFHRALCVASGNEVLVKAWSGVSRQVIIIFSLEHRERTTSYPHVEIHKALRAVLAEADYEEATRVLSDHILRHWAIADR